MPGTLGADVDHGAAVLAHPGPPDALDEPQRCLHVDGERLPPTPRFGLDEGSVGLVGGGVVDEDIDPAEGAEGERGEFLQMGGVGDVTRESGTAEFVGGLT